MYFFSTHQASSYTSNSHSPFLIGEIPPPFGLLSKAEEVSKVANALGLSKQGLLTAEEIALAERQMSPLNSSSITQGERRISSVAEMTLEESASRELSLTQRQIDPLKKPISNTAPQALEPSFTPYTHSLRRHLGN
jgi:hypothetical protein